MSEILDIARKLVSLIEQQEQGGTDAELQVAKLYHQESVLTHPDDYFSLVQKGVNEGWFQKIFLLYLPCIATTKKLLNAVNPFDRDDAYRGKYSKGIIDRNSKGLKLRCNYFDGTQMQVLDEIETYVEVDEMPGYPWVGFGAYIQESASIVCASPAGFIPTIEQNGISHMRICSTYHEQTLPLAHRKPKGLIIGQHNSVKKSTDFWHNGELVFSDKTETATAEGTIKIVIGPQYDHPTNYTTLTAFWLFREMPDELLKKMQAAFTQFFTDLKLNA